MIVCRLSLSRVIAGGNSSITTVVDGVVQESAYRSTEITKLFCGMCGRGGVVVCSLCAET